MTDLNTVHFYGAAVNWFAVDQFPLHSAAVMPRPSMMPPDAITGMVTASTTWGRRLGFPPMLRDADLDFPARRRKSRRKRGTLL
jgi:hypothetical protein